MTPDKQANADVWRRPRSPRPPAPRVARHRSAIRILLTVMSLGGAIAPGGCTSKLEPIFAELHPAMVWPAASKQSRVRYVGQLRGSMDLKAPPKFAERLARIFAGAKEPDMLYGPRTVVCSRDGRYVWIGDPGGRCLHLFDLTERRYTKVEQAGNALLLSPVGMCLGPDESIYVCDSHDVAIHRLSVTTGALLESLRLPEDVRRPVALTYDDSAAELYVVDARAHDVKVLGVDGSLRRIIGRRGNAPGEFNFPCDIADDGKILWIADTGNHRVQGLTRAGEPVISFGQAGDAPGDLAMPKAVALDSDGHVYVVDGRFENVQIFDRSGQLLLAFGEEGTGPGAFWLPGGISIDSQDRIWISDSYNRRVQIFEYIKPVTFAEPQLAGEAREAVP